MLQSVSFLLQNSPSATRDRSYLGQLPDDKSSDGLNKAINQQQANTHALSSIANCPSSQSHIPLESGSKVQLPPFDSSNTASQLASSHGEKVVDSKSSSMGIENDATKAHLDKVVGEQHNQPNQVLSQKSSTLSLINKNSTSLDEPSYNSITHNSSSTKPRHSVPNILDSEGNSNTSTILPLSSNNNHNYSNNISHISNHNTTTIDTLQLSGRTITSETTKQSLTKDTNLEEVPGASNNEIVQTSISNIDKDDLQLKWEAVVGSKFKVVVSTKFFYSLS